jgi:hypothetical protein
MKAMERDPRLFVIPGLVAGAIGVAILLLTAVPYRSPLRGAVPAPAPRRQALRQLAEWRKERQEEERQFAELMRSLDTAKMVTIGKEIVHGRGLCLSCHKVGNDGTGTLGPNLEGVGARAGSRVPGLSDVDYLAQSLYEPAAYVVDGYQPAMPQVTKSPIGLNDLDVLMVMAYLQSLDGTPTVEPNTRLPQQSDGTVAAVAAPRGRKK